MGLSQSSEASEIIGREQGFRVHRVEANSPGQEAGLQSIVDYIVVANGIRFDHDDGSFVKMIAESKGKPMKVCVFNTHTLRTRETILTPRDDWGGTGLLGITIRYDIIQELSKHTLHVLDVYPNSPASEAGLDGFNDYILGVGDLLYDGPDEFGEIVLHNEGRPVRLYVFSVRTEAVREVIITPNRSWGGEGCLGCGVGAGYLHALPPRRDLRDHRAAPAQSAPPLAPSAPSTGSPPDGATQDEPPPPAPQPNSAAGEPVPPSALQPIAIDAMEGAVDREAARDDKALGAQMQPGVAAAPG